MELGTPNDVGDMLGSDEATRLQAERRYQKRWRVSVCCIPRIPCKL